VVAAWGWGQTEQAEQLVLVEGAGQVQADSVHHLVEQPLLFLEGSVDPLLDCVLADVGVDVDGSGLPQSVAAPLGLALAGRVPPAVEVEDVRCRLEVEPLGAGS
jgi:hypothetical protein